MLRSLFHASRLAALPLVVAAIAVEACGSITDAITIPPTPGFSLRLGATTMLLTAGTTASLAMTAARTGDLTAAITYTVTGAPAGLTTTVSGTTVADSSTLVVVASPTLAAATYPIVVNATSSGTISHQATLTVTVNAASGEAPAIGVVATGAHACALSAAGAAYCWGYNGHGELGNGTTGIENPRPVAVAGGLSFQMISVSKVEGITCALTYSGVAYCWGRNDGGQLGDGTTTDRLVPTRVAGGLTFRSIAAGNEHVCAVATNGTAYCWGSTPNGAFGDGTTGRHLTPAIAAPGLTFQSIAAGSDYTCGLTTSGAAYCWGLGVQGQLGNGNAAITTTPVAVTGGLVFRSLATGGQSACGLTIAGKAYCWGQSTFGTVGDGTSSTTGGSTRHLTPVPVSGGLTFLTLSAGYETMCGVAVGGAGYCWGYNFGAVGDGTSDHRPVPTAVAGELTFRTIAAGTGHSCGLTATEGVYCWGDNTDGGLADGTTISRTTPVAVRWP